jgi:cobalt/nickel transport system permease protein
MAHRRGLVDRADPRVRLLAATAFVLLDALSARMAMLVAALAVVALTAAAAGLRPRALATRLIPVNLFVLLAALLLPWTTPGTAVRSWGAFQVTQEGLRLTAVVALKANGIALAIIALLGSLDLATLGHAMSHLRVPQKLIHLMLFAVRYVDVLARETHRLRASMRTRGFRPRMDWHTYRSYGYLVGVLLVRSLDRSERILAAMKCRGFRGQFYLLDHFAASRYDLGFSLFAGLILAALGVLGLG